MAKTDCRSLFSGRHARTRAGLHLSYYLLLVLMSSSAVSTQAESRSPLQCSSSRNLLQVYCPRLAECLSCPASRSHGLCAPVSAFVLFRILCLFFRKMNLSAGSCPQREEKMEGRIIQGGRRRMIFPYGLAWSLVGRKVHHHHPSPLRCFTRLLLSCFAADLSHLYNGVCACKYLNQRHDGYNNQKLEHSNVKKIQRFWVPCGAKYFNSKIIKHTGKVSSKGDRKGQHHPTKQSSREGNGRRAAPPQRRKRRNITTQEGSSRWSPTRPPASSVDYNLKEVKRRQHGRGLHGTCKRSQTACRTETNEWNSNKHNIALLRKRNREWKHYERTRHLTRTGLSGSTA